MLKGAEILALVEMSDREGPYRGTLLGQSSPPLVGLSLYVEATTEAGEPFRLLFDTSTSWRNLRHNAEVAGIDLRALDAIVLSHWHYDHSAALPRLLRHVGRPLPVYAPPLTQPLDPLKAGIAFRLPRETDLRLCRQPVSVIDGVRTTGSREVVFPRAPLTVCEQGLALSVRDRSTAVLVGCSHAPLEWLVEQAAGSDPVGWLLGGFHFASPTSEERRAELIAFLRERGLERISPMHCTTRAGIERVRRELAEQFFPFGLGDRHAV